MPENSPTTPAATDPIRTPEGQIVDQSTSIPPSTEAPPPQASTTQPSETPKTPETKADAKAPKSLLNEESPEPKGAPEKYESFKVPEGFKLDEGFVKDANTLFKKLDINQAGAQELVDLHTKMMQEIRESESTRKMNERLAWRDEINSDPEIGGSKLKGVKTSIGKLIGLFGSDKVAEGFRDAMDSTGAGDNPAVVRGLYAISKLLTEGGAVRGNGPSPLGQTPSGPSQPTAAQAMYPHLQSNR